MVWRRVVLAGLFLISALILIGGSGPFKALNQHDLSLVNPLEGSFGTGFTDTTLASAVASIGVAHKALMLPPGTWTIANDLTIPANVELQIPPGAVFSISSGRRLTINGPLAAGMRRLFTGDGSVVFGSRVHEVHPHWFGALCDGTTNDQPALQKAIDSAHASMRQVVRMPSAVCRVTADTNLRVGVNIFGQGRHISTLLVAGAGVRGLVFNPAGLTELSVKIQDLAINGNDTTVGNLIDVRSAGDVYLSNLRLATTGGSGIYWDYVMLSSIRDVRIHDFTVAGIDIIGGNTTTIDAVSAQSHTVAGQAAFRCKNAAFLTLINFTVEGVLKTPRAMAFDNCGGVTTINPFFEYTATNPVIGVNKPSSHLHFFGGHYHTGGGQVAFEFNGLAHEDIVVRGVTCVLGNKDYCFKGVESVTSMEYCHNHLSHLGVGTSHHFNPVTVSETVDCLEKGKNKVIVGGGLRLTRNGFPLQAADATTTTVIATADSWDFDALANATCQEISKRVAGVASGDKFIPQIPISLIQPGVTYGWQATAVDQVTIKRCNNSGAPTGNPDPVSIPFFVFKTANIQ